MSIKIEVAGLDLSGIQGSLFLKQLTDRFYKESLNYPRGRTDREILQVMMLRITPPVDLNTLKEQLAKLSSDELNKYSQDYGYVPRALLDRVISAVNGLENGLDD